MKWVFYPGHSEMTDSCLNPSKTDARMILFGSRLRIQIPPLSPSPVRKFEFGSANFGMDVVNSPPVFIGRLSATEMELSDGYTCVISHGPIPKTNHIFDNCVVGSCYGVVGFASPMKINEFPDNRSCFQSESFLSSC